MSADLSSRLSHRPKELLHSMITIADPPKPMDANLRDHPSSIGIVDRLPIEVLQEVFGLLDFQSLTRFARVSLQGKNVVKYFPAYRDLMNYAPDALAALGQTKLIHLHSASDLLAALRTERCALCPEYGVYLFLPTCERCCWQCLQFNFMRRVVSPTVAGEVFALSPEMVQQIPAMFSIPGTYGLSSVPVRNPVKLCSMSDAKKLATSVCGSAENLEAAILKIPNVWSGSDLEAAALSGYNYLDLLKMLSQGVIGAGRYFGTASIPFPSRTAPGVIEHGLWCKGCKWTYNQYRHDQIPAHVIADMVPRDCDPDRVLFDRTRCARSRIGLLAHVGRCYGAQQLLEKWKLSEHYLTGEQTIK
ncbi:F-box domain-containing protein [Hypoxylon argillaceum]|nr:F-box domain-containing protein [Hypoxylon argillaceum]KAI1148377.1 F-box domain-containing protein [Nemania diffusa]